MKNNSLTIHDITKALNIHSFTVSRTLNTSWRVAQETKICFSGPQELKIYQNRLDGSKGALKTHDIPFRSKLVVGSRFMESEGAASAVELLSLPYKIDGIFTANDVSAFEAMKLPKNTGIKIPQELAVVDVSYEPTFWDIETSLTTIDPPGFQIEKKATAIVLKLIKKGNNSHNGNTVIPKSSKIERDSSQK